MSLTEELSRKYAHLLFGRLAHEEFETAINEALEAAAKKAENCFWDSSPKNLKELIAEEIRSMKSKVQP